MSLRIFLSAILLAWLVPGHAQHQVRITGTAPLEHPVTPRRVKALEPALLEAGFSKDVAALVREYGEPGSWPAGITTAAALAVNKPYVINYVGYELARYGSDTAQWAVVRVPALVNVHMPEDMRPKYDFFLLVPAGMLEQVDPGTPMPAFISGPAWARANRVRIVRPDDLYANYELGKDSTGLAALRMAGMGEGEIEWVVFRSVQQNWPEGINTLEKRQAQRKRIGKYRVYEAARWDDRMLLIAPASKNKRMPRAMRPHADIYFIYAISGLKTRNPQ